LEQSIRKGDRVVTEPKVVTLANLAECTAQQVADHICYRLARQDYKRSLINAEESCGYRGFEEDSNGHLLMNKPLRCAAGHCMTDEEYTDLNTKVAADRTFSKTDLAANTIEGQPWEALVDEGLVSYNHYSLISRLQTAHDDTSKGGMRLLLVHVCQEFGLETTYLEQ
jgi:hypothetical protein